MRKIFILMAMTIALFSSCVDNDDNPTPTTTDVEQEENPTEDAVSVTTDKTYVMYGEFDEDFGNALGRRLQGTMTSPSMADVFVVDPSAVSKSDIMGTEELKTMIQRTESGEASVVLTKATFREFYDWAQLYVLGYLLMELENYSGDLGYDSPKAAPARRRMANVMRNAYMAGQSQAAATRGSTVNGMELDWEHVDSWPAEKQNAVMFDGFAQSGDNELFVMNAAATLNGDAEVEQPKNDYEWGNKADAVADWLNSQDAEKAQSRAGLKRFARAATRAASADISDLMSAQTKEFVFDYKYPNQGKNAVRTAGSSLKVQYKVYSAYDFHEKKEYYQVRQNIKVMNDKIHAKINGISWWVRSGDGDYTLGRGAWMKRIDTKMWLEGNGAKSIVSAGPKNANGITSTSTSSGGSSTTTIGTSEGYSVGVSWGSSLGLTGPSANLSGSYGESYTKTYSQSDGITWSTTTGWSTSDLSTNMTLGNDKNTVSWVHTGNTPNNYYSTGSDNVKLLLKSTCVTDEYVLWMVENPSGSYTLKASFNVVSGIGKIKGTTGEMPNFNNTQDNQHDISFVLNAPDRFKYEWSNVIYDYGTNPKDMSQTQYTSYIDDYIEKRYGEKHNSGTPFCWAGRFITTEATQNGSDNAKAVFQTFKNSIVGEKVALYLKGVRGKMVFGLKPVGSINLIDKITLDMDNLYNEGETLTDIVNNYQLTFKVTKKNQEVELYSVPKDFTGELVIPEKIGYGIQLAVTSLASHCAQGRTGITAVTIPSTVSIIKVGALEKLGITEINIPEGVKTLSPWSFHYNTQLTKVYLPSTLETIHDHAFYRNNMLAEVHIKATTPPALSKDGFTPRYSDAVLYVPKGCKDAYANAKEWKYFKNIVEE